MPRASSVSGVIADTLAALLVQHPSIEWPSGSMHYVCATCNVPVHGGPNSPSHAAHQAEVLAAAGVGDLRALLDDLRGMHHQCWCEECEGGCAHCIVPWPCSTAALLDRYAPPDPTPKEQQP